MNHLNHINYLIETENYDELSEYVPINEIISITAIMNVMVENKLNNTYTNENDIINILKNTNISDPIKFIKEIQPIIKEELTLNEGVFSGAGKLVDKAIAGTAKGIGKRYAGYDKVNKTFNVGKGIRNIGKDSLRVGGTTVAGTYIYDRENRLGNLDPLKNKIKDTLNINNKNAQTIVQNQQAQAAQQKIQALQNKNQQLQQQMQKHSKALKIGAGAAALGGAGYLAYKLWKQRKQQREIDNKINNLRNIVDKNRSV